MYRHIAKIVPLGFNNDQCYIPNCVVTNRVIKRSRCTDLLRTRQIDIAIIPIVDHIITGSILIRQTGKTLGLNL